MMQLATSQRPHPPPVPPRPSRQVVAEALKRTPRPPCPTRQAPPPPNTKPWRSEEQETSQGRDGGRTVIYESLKESSNCQEIRAASEPRVINVSSERDGILSRRRSTEEINGRIKDSTKIGKDRYTEEKIVKVRNGSNGATSERPQVENHRESRNIKPQQPHEQKSQLAQLRSNGKELHDWKNSTVDSEINDNELHVGKEKRSSHDDTNVNEELPILLNNRIDVCKIGSVGENSQDNEKMTIEIGNCPIGNKAIENHFEGPTKTKLQDSTNEKDTKTTNTVKSNETLVTNGKMSVECHSSLAKNLDTERSKITRISMEPTKILKSEYVANDKAVDPRSKNNSSINRVEGDEFFETTYGSSTTISSDDCATVVVIDEPERKIAFNEDNDNIHHQDWLEAGVRYSSTKITLAGDETIDRSNELSRLDDVDDKDDDCNYEDLKNENEQQAYCDLDFARIRERIAMSSLQGLPPLPRSLSGFNLNEGRREAGEPPPPPTRSSSKTPKNIKSTQPSSSRPSPPGRQLTTLDTQLAILRKEMFGLRQLDLSLLSQLWSLNESIQEFRQLLQDQEDRAPSPSPSSEEGDDISYGSHPPPPPRRPAPLLHHHRPPRPPRPLRPPASDESPSSEEYGAV